MNKASHKRKVKMARKMRTEAETSRKVKIINKKVTYGYRNIFDSKAWEDRKAAIKDRVMRQIAAVKKRKAIRLKKAKANV